MIYRWVGDLLCRMNFSTDSFFPNGLEHWWNFWMLSVLGGILPCSTIEPRCAFFFDCMFFKIIWNVRCITLTAFCILCLQGASGANVLVAFQISKDDMSKFRKKADSLGYEYTEEFENKAYQLLMQWSPWDLIIWTLHALNPPYKKKTSIKGLVADWNDYYLFANNV